MLKITKSFSVKWLIWLIALYGIAIEYPTPLSNERFNASFSYSLFYLLWVLALFYFIEIKKKCKNSVSTWLFGVIFSLLYNITFWLTADETPTLIRGTFYVHGFFNLALTLLAVFSWTVVFSSTLAIFNYYFAKNWGVKEQPKYIFLIILLVWALTTFLYLPGQISWDACKQFCEFEAKHVQNLNFTYFATNHNPWFTTLFFGYLFNFGKNLFNVNFGIFLVVAVQFIITALIYSQAVKFIWAKAGRIAGIIGLLFFCSPLFSTYAMTIEKSTLYYAFCVWFYLNYINLLEKSLNNEIKNTDCIKYVVAMLLFSLFRNDAIYISFISTFLLIVFIAFRRKHLVKMVISLAIFICIMGGWRGYLKYRNVIPGSVSEALTIPTRQLSYVYMNGDLSERDKRVIDEITPLNKIKKNYDINQGDNLKNLYPVNTFLNTPTIINEVVTGKKTVVANKETKAEIKDYLKTWVRVGLTHPGQYINVYLAANSQYLNPFLSDKAPNKSDSLFMNYTNRQLDYVAPSWSNKYTYLFSSKMRQLEQKVDESILSFPIICILLNVALPLWIVLLLIEMAITKRDLKLFVVLIPLIGLVLLTTLVPVNGYSRYVIGTSGAMLVAFAWIKDKVEK